MTTSLKSQLLNILPASEQDPRALFQSNQTSISPTLQRKTGVDELKNILRQSHTISSFKYHKDLDVLYAYYVSSASRDVASHLYRTYPKMIGGLEAVSVGTGVSLRIDKASTFGIVVGIPAVKEESKPETFEVFAERIKTEFRKAVQGSLASLSSPLTFKVDAKNKRVYAYATASRMQRTQFQAALQAITTVIPNRRVTTVGEYTLNMRFDFADSRPVVQAPLVKKVVNPKIQERLVELATPALRNPLDAIRDVVSADVLSQVARILEGERLPVETAARYGVSGTSVRFLFRGTNRVLDIDTVHAAIAAGKGNVATYPSELKAFEFGSTKIQNPSVIFIKDFSDKSNKALFMVVFDNNGYHLHCRITPIA